MRRIEQYQWLALLSVFACVYLMFNILSITALETAQSAEVLGQGTAAAPTSKLSNSNLMPLVSVDTRKEAEAITGDQIVDDQLFYRLEPEDEQKTEAVESADASVTPKIDLKLELRQKVILQSIVGPGAVVNGKFVQIGEVITQIENSRGEVLPVVVIAIGDNSISASAGGETIEVRL